MLMARHKKEGKIKMTRQVGRAKFYTIKERRQQKLTEEKRCKRCNAKMRFMRKAKTMIDEYGEKWPAVEYYECEQCRAKWTYYPEYHT
jgi:uncharacterized protein with PIN domain